MAQKCNKLCKLGEANMVITNRKCSECGSTMLLDKVKEKDGVKTFYYACVNPNCKERGKAYTATGIETESSIRNRA